MGSVGGEARLSLSSHREAHVVAVVPRLVRADGWMHRGLGEPGGRHGMPYAPGFPLQLGAVGDVLQLAAAALAEDRTARNDTLRRRLEHASHAHDRSRHTLRPPGSRSWKTPGHLNFHYLARKPSNKGQPVGRADSLVASYVDAGKIFGSWLVTYLDHWSIGQPFGQKPVDSYAVVAFDVAAPGLDGLRYRNLVWLLWYHGR